MLYFILLENRFPKEQVLFLTANANKQTGCINDLTHAFDNGDDERFHEILMDITNSFGDEDKTKSFGFIDKPDGYSDDDVDALCNYLKSLSPIDSNNTYESLYAAAKNCRIINVPMACIKGTDQLDIELKKHEENKYLILRRGIIEGCKFLKEYLKKNENIRFMDFIKIENNHPNIEITNIEIKNYLDALIQSLGTRQPRNDEALNIEYRLFLRTLVHEWEENIEANALKDRNGGNLKNIHDIYTFAWIMKMTRNWVSHANLLEPLDSEFIAFLFLVNMRAMFKLPESIQYYEAILLRVSDHTSVETIDEYSIKDYIENAEKDIDGILTGVKISCTTGNGKCKHFGQKINDLYRCNTGNPNAESHDFKKLLMQYFWISQKKQNKLIASSDNFLPTLARHIYQPSFTTIEK